MLSFECIKNEKSVYFLLTSAVNHLRTTKNWVKTVLVFPNLVKLYQPV